MLKPRNSFRYLTPAANERGASIVEFAIVGIITFGLIGIIFDLGLGIRNYTLLTYATSRAARHAALSHQDCEKVKERAESGAAAFANNTGIPGVFEAHVQSIDGSTKQQIVLSGTATFSCIFCSFLPRSIVLSASSNYVLERNLPGCE